MAVFVFIVAFLLWPFKTLSITTGVSCTLLAKSFCMFVIGCYIAEVFKDKISRKALKYIAIIGVIFALHILIEDGIASLHNPPPISILWFPYNYVVQSGANPFFLCLGIVVNHHREMIPGKPYPFRPAGSIWKDICMALLAFVTYMILMYLINVPAIFEDPISKTAWAIRYMIRILCLPIWVMMLIHIYRCLTSNWTLSFKDRFPKLLRFIASLAPIGILFILFNSARPFSIWLWFDIIYYLLTAYAVIVALRFTIHLLRALMSKDFGWKEIFLGNLK